MLLCQHIDMCCCDGTSTRVVVTAHRDMSMCRHIDKCCVDTCCVGTSTSFVSTCVAPSSTAGLCKELRCSQSLSFGHIKAWSEHLPNLLNPLLFTVNAAFKINLLFWAPVGCIHFETVRPGIFLCTPLAYSYDNFVKKRAHIGRTCPKNMRDGRRVHP